MFCDRLAVAVAWRGSMRRTTGSLLAVAAIVLTGAGAAFADVITGTRHDDNLVGTQRGDLIRALDGDDRVRGLGGSDRIDGGKGDDKLNGDGECPKDYDVPGKDKDKDKGKEIGRASCRERA